MKYYEAELRGYPSADPQDADYDPILVKAYQNLSNINLSPYRERCSKCGQRDYGIASVLTGEFTCRGCILRNEMDRLHSLPEEEKNYKIYKLRKARKDHAMKSKIVAKTTTNFSIEDLGTVSEQRWFQSWRIREEYERSRS